MPLVSREESLALAIEAALEAIDVSRAGGDDFTAHRGPLEAFGQVGHLPDRHFLVFPTTMRDPAIELGSCFRRCGYEVVVRYTMTEDLRARVHWDAREIIQALETLSTSVSYLSFLETTGGEVDVGPDRSVLVTYEIGCEYREDPEAFAAALDLTKSWLAAGDIGEYWTQDAIATALASGQPFTLAYRFMLDASGGSRSVVGLGYASNDKLAYFNGSDAAYSNFAAPSELNSTALSQDAWHSAVHSYGASECALYVDGAEAESLTQSIHSLAYDKFTVGAYRNNGGAGWPLSGHLAEIVVWLSPLTARQAANYHAGAGTDVRDIVGVPAPDYYYPLSIAAGSPLVVPNKGSAGSAPLTATASITTADIVTEAP